MRIKRQSGAGISLVELVCVLAIVAITTAFAATQMQTMSQIQAVRAKTAAFEASARFARHQAISLGTRVSICRTQDGTSCASAAFAAASVPPDISLRDWASGWLVFTDGDPRGEINGDDRVLVSEGAWTAGSMLQPERTGTYVLSYRASGVGIASAMNFTVSPNRASNKTARSAVQETVCINMTGQVRHQAGGC